MMTISVKKMLIILGIFYALIYFANGMIAKAIDGGVNKQKSSLSVEQSEAIERPALKKKARHSKTEGMTADERYELAKKNFDPAELKRKYGISVVPRRHGPTSAEEWQDHVSKNIVTPEFLNKPKTQKLLATIQTDEEKYIKKMEHLQKNIDALKSKLVENPYDKKSEQLLQNLYRLQAVTRAIENTVVIKKSATGPEVSPSQEANL